MFVIGLLILSTIISFSDGQLTVVGSCPDIRAKPDFDFYQYEGIWYEVEKYFFLPQITGTCVYVHYKDFNHHNLTFTADIVQIEKFTRKHIVNPCTGKLVHDRYGRIDLRVNIHVPLSPVSVRVDYPYSVLDTDYNTFSIKWACQQIGIYNIQSIWILSKSRTFSSETREYVHQRLRDFGLRSEFLTPSDNTDCPSPRDSITESPSDDTEYTPPRE